MRKVIREIVANTHTHIITCVKHALKDSQPNFSVEVRGHLSMTHSRPHTHCTMHTLNLNAETLVKKVCVFRG